jgi:hypothetical protein
MAIQVGGSNDSLAYNNRGIAYQNLGQTAQATADQARACSLNSQYCPPPTPTPRPTSRPVATPPSISVDCYTAPDGAVITAWINGEQVATATVVGGSYSIAVAQEDYEFTGELVWFKVEGIEAMQEAKWVQGGADILNLSAFKNWFVLRSTPSQLQLTIETVPPHVFVGTASICSGL